MVSFKKKAFTILELLIVISILAILTSAVILTINPKKQLSRTRDTRRLADVGTLVTAIQWYNNEHGTFPDSVDTTRVSNQLVTGGSLYKSAGGWINSDLSKYLPKMVVDPINTGENVYRYRHNNVGYEVDTALENLIEKHSIDGGNNDNRYELGTDLTVLD